MDIQDLAEEYQRKTDEELLRLALNSEQLTEEASAALATELARRRINDNDKDRLKAFREEKEQLKIERDRDPGKLCFLYPYGIGRKRFGKAESIYNSQTHLERFKTTVFVVLFWVPLIPTGTYLVERKREFLSDEMTILERLPLDWEQVLKVWIVAASTLLALMWILKLLPRFLFRS